VTIPEGVTIIELMAFAGDPELTSITLPSTLSNIGANVFMACDALTTVTVNATTPPVLPSRTVIIDSFPSTNANFKIKVPSASVNAYKNAAGWIDYASYIVSQ